MSRPFKLYRLQQLDSQLDWLKGRLANIEAALKEDSAIKQAILEAEAAASLSLNAQKVVNRAEQEVQQQRLKIEQTEATLYGGKVKNPKELTDLQNEISALKRYLKVLEDRQLEAMMAEEESAIFSKKKSVELEKTQAHFSQQTIELNDEREKLLRDVERYEEERQAAVVAIQPEDLDLYKQLREKRRGIAVSKVTDRACSACGSTLNAALLHSAHSPSMLSRCDACGRILYVG